MESLIPINNLCSFHIYLTDNYITFEAHKEIILETTSVYYSIN